MLLQISERASTQSAHVGTISYQRREASLLFVIISLYTLIKTPHHRHAQVAVQMFESCVGECRDAAAERLHQPAILGRHKLVVLLFVVVVWQELRL